MIPQRKESLRPAARGPANQGNRDQNSNPDRKAPRSRAAVPFGAWQSTDAGWGMDASTNACICAEHNRMSNRHHQVKSDSSCTSNQAGSDKQKAHAHARRMPMAELLERTHLRPGWDDQHRPYELIAPAAPRPLRSLPHKHTPASAPPLHYPATATTTHQP